MEICNSCGLETPSDHLNWEGLCSDCYSLLPKDAFNRLIGFAQQIAKQQRNEDSIQPLDAILEKFEHEKDEFRAEMERETGQDQQLDLLSEAADLVYYAAQAAYHGTNVQHEVHALLVQAGIMTWDATQAAEIKYSYRVQTVKDKDAEREALRSLLARIN